MVESCVKSNEEAKKELQENRPRRLALAQQLFLDYYLFFAPARTFATCPRESEERVRKCLRKSTSGVVVSRCSIRPSWATRVVGVSEVIAASKI